MSAQQTAAASRDPLEVYWIAAAVLSREPHQLRRPRSQDGVLVALSVLSLPVST